MYGQLIQRNVRGPAGGARAGEGAAGDLAEGQLKHMQHSCSIIHLALAKELDPARDQVCLVSRLLAMQVRTSSTDSASDHRRPCTHRVPARSYSDSTSVTRTVLVIVRESGALTPWSSSKVRHGVNKVQLSRMCIDDVCSVRDESIKFAQSHRRLTFGVSPISHIDRVPGRPESRGQENRHGQAEDDVVRDDHRVGEL